ncbi:MAG: DUF2662 domain-containing protein [Actinobacteria bacterium]|nr:DUF2662 domain-containing protein [Actinomycetota bacterium]
MSFLEKAEERIELAFGSVFARLSKAELQPVEITQAVRRAMDHAAKQIDLTRVLVPHRYLILVSGHDSARISPAMLLSIKTEIAMHAAKQGYRLAGELTLKIEVDPKLPRGQVRVGSSGSNNSVHWFASLLVNGKRIPLQKGTTTIGRDQSSDIAIDDRGMSRVHFEVAWNDQGAAIRDRGSTNGTFVDGIKIQEVALTSGNKITAGRSEFVFELIARESQ